MAITCRDEAMRWVHRYAIGGAAFAALPLPISTTAGLAALEVHMINFIGGVYDEPVSNLKSIAAGGSFEVMGAGLKFVATRVAAFVPGPAGFVVRAGIAAVVIESLGHAITAYFERKHPGKLFSAAV
ncbi:hypothetical protein KEG38_40010 [Polyangium jinanense]|uniref:DUF697 domain-containing protein n=2 Tax=Polyangium jinanense TaxID=2829994 RepID=A0A9X4AUB1_9BACT|nr:hypothetical protein [Polyangium jinanense]MDC3960109.1 hypothetical protein [Polyangium jinanense]MDC3984426.1 hypothetical protein [Polyangium jinanense]